METSGVISSAILDGILSTIDTRGIDPAEVSARAGLGNSSLYGQSHFLPLVSFTSILEMMSEFKHDPVLGARLGKSFDFGTLGAVSKVFLTAPSLGDGITQFIRYFPTLQSNTACALVVNGDIARFSYSIVDNTVKHKAQDANFTEATLCSMVEAVLGKGWKPSYVDLAHAPGDDASLYAETFACPMRFQRRDNAILLPASCLDTPSPHRDPVLNRRLIAELEDTLHRKALHADFATSVKAWITSALCQSDSTDIHIAAADFGMSQRNFQRRLADLGVNYVGLRNTVRVEIAKCMLALTNLPIPEISAHLGYSETSAFARSFRKLADETPARFREVARADLHAKSDESEQLFQLLDNWPFTQH
ncbi:AraC family transcriptional regulator [Methyloligella solikamskensis]|uniref:AraC family transcriptional regulator n=1 Tax=Methyloligella solikamskensis TaxID=1177756 RepID=A0ABW3JCG8_9HYPH